MDERGKKDQIITVLNKELKKYQDTCVEVKQKIDEKGWIYILTWNYIEEAAFAEQMIRIISHYLQGINNPERTFAEFTIGVEQWIKNVRDELCGDPEFGFSSLERPWRGGSTSNGSNRFALIKWCNALRAEYKLLHQIKRIIDSYNI